jgi:MFS family permease
MNSQQQQQGLPPHLKHWLPSPTETMQAQNNHPLSRPSQPNHPLTSPKKKSSTKPKHEEYKVYSARWIMLFYMSLLNLLSDWTCYSVAPIALLTKQAFGEVDPESLVTVFLGANAVASAMEPAILGRLGLRRTVVFGSMLLMLGSIVKSGGVWDLLTGLTARRTEDAVEDSSDETWRLYLGFFLVGLSQPLYQCTPALLSASWFPENERTMATGVALNSNQLGIGCAFVFGTILVGSEEDIIPYFGLLSVVSTFTFIGAALQFDDAPPTPPSDTARVIKGDLVINIPRISFSLRGLSIVGSGDDQNVNDEKKQSVVQAPAPACGEESTELKMDLIQTMEHDFNVAAPSPAPTNEPVVPSSSKRRSKKEKIEKQSEQTDNNQRPPLPYYDPSVGVMGQNPTPDQFHAQQYPPQQYPPQPYPYILPPHYYYPPPPVYYQHNGPQYTELHPGFYHGYDEYGQYHNGLLENSGYDEYAPEDFDGIEPIMTQLDHKLDIDIRDDQLIQQVKACFARPGFSHCIVAFTTSGIIINTLSTFMDYLVTLGGAGKEYVGIVGGPFQLLIMVASLVFGGWTDASRKYYFVTLAMLMSGAFALSYCNIQLDADNGADLRLALLVVGVLAGPLQPISTELGVEVVYPLSENTVLVIQQLFSNLLSALFIPLFKALKDVGTAKEEANTKFEAPMYTFSFYMLIVIHALSTLYFSTFNGKYLRHEAELAKKAKIEREENEHLMQEQQESGYGSVEPN